MIEYPGYSIYAGTATEDNIVNDIDPVWNFVTRIMRFDRNDVIVMGRSIGSGASIHLAHQHYCGGLILISPFTSLKSAAEHNFTKIASMLVKERFDNLTKMKSIKAPCLFIHGKEDSLVPYEHSKALYGNLVCLIRRGLSKTSGNTNIFRYDPSIL